MDTPFHVGILEQLDVALDHIAENNPNSTRYAFFLIDNAMELILREQAENKNLKLQHLHDFTKEDKNKNLQELEKVSALLDSDNFKERLNGLEKCKAINTNDKNVLLNLHSFRNRSFHVGDRFPDILRELASLYLKQIPSIIESQKLSSISSGHFDKLPLRIKKYTGMSLSNMRGSDFYDFDKMHTIILGVYKTISEAANSLVGNVSYVLSNEHARKIDEFISEAGYVADHGPFVVTLEDVLVLLKLPEQTFANEAETFFYTNGNTIGDDYIKHLKETYSKDLIKNPQYSWEKVTTEIRNLNEIEALEKYCRFFDEKGMFNEYIRLLKKHNEAVFWWEDLQMMIARGK